MADILWTFPNAFSWMKSFEFWLTFHWFFWGGTFDKKATLVQIITWRQTGDETLSGQNDDLFYWRIYAPLSLGELTGSFCSGFLKTCAYPLGLSKRNPNWSNHVFVAPRYTFCTGKISLQWSNILTFTTPWVNICLYIRYHMSHH